MKRIARLFLASMICVAIAGSDASVTARGRNDRNSGSGQKHEMTKNHNRPGNMGRPAGGNNHATQPGKPNHGNNHGHAPQPGWGNNRPAPGPNPGHAHHPGYIPNHRPAWNHMPSSWHYFRPTPPPPHFRPYVNWPRFSTVLGISFGTTIALTIDALLNTGYNVAGNYGNTVYLQNVNMLGYMWPEATLNYTDTGRLSGSEFISYSTYAGRSLYNTIYNQICRNYGNPYSNDGMRATWWGPERQYITLSFASGIGSDGYSRYYTTLNYGIY